MVLCHRGVPLVPLTVHHLNFSAGNESSVTDSVRYRVVHFSGGGGCGGGGAMGTCASVKRNESVRSFFPKFDGVLLK